MSLLVIITIVACNSSQDKNVAIDVQYKGALKNIMKKGNLEAQMSLSGIEDTAHLYALGAIENLKGEIQIFDGKPYNTLVQKDTIAFDKGYSKNATLYVGAKVDKWNHYNIPNTIKSKADLESFIHDTALSAGISVSSPFPFLLEGELRRMSWHIINWPEDDKVHSHEKHITSGKYGQLENVPAVMLGFYSDSHHAIITHHTTNMHIHMKTVDEKLAGHVDDLELGSDMILKLPAI